MKRNANAPELPQRFRRAWEYGRATAAESTTEIVYSHLVPDWVFEDISTAEFFEIGRAGAELPHYVTGWRYGDIPSRPGGESYNYREDQPECGTSVMQLDGQEKIHTLSELRGSFRNRPVVRIGGWLNTRRVGGDGEPLLIAAEKIE